MVNKESFPKNKVKNEDDVRSKLNNDWSDENVTNNK